HHYGCISCDKPAHWTGGKWHGSHFKSVGSNSALQFNLLNINKSCDQCNFFMAGNIGPYETRLRQKIGDEKVDWLKNHPRGREYTPEYLDRLARILRKKIRRTEKRLGIK
ncbi:recombination protein NinG, partial [Cronobacter muytjensii]|uniref:recombination protein NinG n=1 Tax=Cronobacter muytjensii TaxID=413501 RepID=UPI0034D67058